MRSNREFQIDQFELLDRDPNRGAELSSDLVRSIAFEKEEPVQVESTKHFTIMTNAADLNMARLRSHFEQVRTTVREELQLTENANEPIRVLIFKKLEEYHAFVPRFAKQLGAVSAAPKSDGLHLQGLAISSWSENQGTLRPTYTHEFVHSLLSHEVLIDSSRSDWLQEGMASYFQLKFHPQENFAAIVRRGVVTESLRMPWESLIAGKDVEINRYWQAATLCDLLLHHPDYRGHWPELIKYFQGVGEADLRPMLKPMGKDAATMEDDWKRFCLDKYQ